MGKTSYMFVRVRTGGLADEWLETGLPGVLRWIELYATCYVYTYLWDMPSYRV